jgi:uncharacterized membrane protein YfcA
MTEREPLRYAAADVQRPLGLLFFSFSLLGILIGPTSWCLTNVVSDWFEDNWLAWMATLFLPPTAVFIISSLTLWRFRRTSGPFRAWTLALAGIVIPCCWAAAYAGMLVVCDRPPFLDDDSSWLDRE